MTPLPPLIEGEYPVVGHVPYLTGLKNPVPFFLEGYRRHGPVFAAKMGDENVAVLLGPEAHRFVLERETEHLSWGAAYSDGVREMFGRTALPAIDGEEHRRRRTPMMASFQHQRLRGYVSQMLVLTRAQTADWVARGEVELVAEASELTFKIACDVLLGVEVGPDYPTFRRLYQQMFGRLSFVLAGLGLPTPARRARRQMAAIAERWVAERKADSSRRDVLSDLIRAGFDTEDVVSQALILMFAGHDTTKSMVSWTLALLLQHPDYLARVLEEQKRVLDAGPLTPEQLRQLPVLDRALREANRLYPPASILLRGVLREFELGGYRIPKGWKVSYLPCVSHYLPDVFAQPFRFDPDRFAPPREEHKQPYALVDFGGGYRICIGKELALLEGKLIVAAILRAFRLELVPGQKIEPSYTFTLARPKHGVRVRVTEATTPNR